MRIRNTIYTLICAFPIMSCAKPITLNVSGLILDNTQRKFLNTNASKVVINISSPGGQVGPSFSMAEHLMEEHVTLNVENICNSACSQVILPIADRVNFINNPLVGFHRSITLDGNYYKNNVGNLSECGSLEKLYFRERRILSHNNLNQDFWKEVDKRLILENYRPSQRSDDCHRYSYNFRHFMWYPTSEQLKNLYGLKFNGSVCADDYDACVEKIEGLAISEGGGGGVSIVIGDIVYTTKLRL